MALLNRWPRKGSLYVPNPSPLGLQALRAVGSQRLQEGRVALAFPVSGQVPAQHILSTHYIVSLVNY